MQESGITRKLLLHASTKLPEIEVPLVTVDFKSVKPILYVLIIGIIAAITILILELILHRVTEIKLGLKENKQAYKQDV
jgi:hypothetical protein